MHCIYWDIVLTLEKNTFRKLKSSLAFGWNNSHDRVQIGVSTGNVERFLYAVVNTVARCIIPLLCELEDLILGFDKFNSRSSELMDDMAQKVVVSTLFPPLADWELVKRFDENRWLITNSRSMSSVCLSCTPSMGMF